MRFDNRQEVARWVLALLMMIACTGARVLAADGGLFDENIQIDGGIWETLPGEKTVVLRSYATLVIGTTRIRARNMIYYMETNEVYAEGDVTFDDPSGSAFICDHLFFQITEWQGIAENVRVKAQRAGRLPKIAFVEEGAVGPGSRQGGLAGTQGEVRHMSVIADQVRSISRDHQELIGARITPSLFYKPHWHFYSRAVNLRQNEKVESWHNFLKIGPVPIFYFPYLIKDLKYDWPWVRMAGGHTSDHGGYVFTKTGLDFDDNSAAPFRLENMFFDIDWRQHRGWAFGVETDYGMGTYGQGKFDFYWTDEGGISRTEDQHRAFFDNRDSIYRSDHRWNPSLYRNESRYTFDWEHTQKFNDYWDLRAESHIYSDPDFREEYFEWDDKLDKDPETYVDLRRWHPNWQLEIIGSIRPNKWQSQTVYQPEVQINVPGFRLWDTPLYVKSQMRVGRVARYFNQDLDRFGLLENEDVKVKHGDKYEANRFHQEVSVQAPVHVGELFVLKPYAGARATYYSDIYGRPTPDSELTAAQARMRDLGRFHSSHVTNDEDGRWNTAMDWGVEASTRLYGSFDNGSLRHVIEPTISFRGQEKPDIHPEWLLSFDEVDTFDEEHYLEFDLNQKLQKKIGGALRDIVHFDIKFRYYPLDDEAERYILGEDRADNYDSRSFTEIEFDLIVQPTDHLRLWTYGLVDPHDGQLNRLGMGADWQYQDRLRLYLYHLYYRGEYWRYPTRSDISRTTLAMRMPLWNQDSRYAAEVAVTYDWDDSTENFNGIVEYRATIFRDLDTFELGVSFVDDRKDDDKGVFIELRPKGWMGIDRPSSASDAASRQMPPSRYGRQIPEAEGEAGQNPSTQKIGETRPPEIRMPQDDSEVEEPDRRESLQGDPKLVPGEHDMEFEGELPKLQGAGEDPGAEVK